MENAAHEKDVKTITGLVADLFDIGAIYRQGRNYVFSMTFRFQRDKSLKLIRERLKLGGYRFTLTERDDILVLTIDPRQRFRIPALNIILFLLTLLSVYVVPVFFRSLDFDQTLTDLANGAGLEFTIALISILLVHEMGHFVAGRRRNVITSWPYFIPAPNIIGTFGAIIKSRSPFWNRRDLIEVGASGPIAGWVVAVAWLVYGLSKSTYVPMDLEAAGGLILGDSLSMSALTWLVLGPAPEGHTCMLGEAAFAGWVGLIVTAINLLPIGQLDGGHILYGLSQRTQKLWGRLAMIGLIVLGFKSSIWWFFAAFGLLFGVNHPPTLDDRRPLEPHAVIMGVTAFAILVLSFTPVPFR